VTVLKSVAGRDVLVSESYCSVHGTDSQTRLHSRSNYIPLLTVALLFSQSGQHFRLVACLHVDGHLKNCTTNAYFRISCARKSCGRGGVVFLGLALFLRFDILGASARHWNGFSGGRRYRGLAGWLLRCATTVLKTNMGGVFLLSLRQPFRPKDLCGILTGIRPRHHVTYVRPCCSVWMEIISAIPQCHRPSKA